MIIKYQSENTWVFIDNIRRPAVKYLDCDALEKEYDETEKEDYAMAERLNGVKLPKEIAKVNKVFYMAASVLADEGVNRRSENLLNENMLDRSAVAILAYLEDCKEFDAILLVTNQKAYLMNDKGQTIERLN